MRRILSVLCFAMVTGGLLPRIAGAATTVRSEAGVDAAAILDTVDLFRGDLGVNNGGGPCVGSCVQGVGRREIGWDGVPDAFSSGGANPFPGNFFNLPTGSPAGRVRGAQFATTGTFETSADSDSDGDGNPGPIATLFGNHNAANADDFAAFSPERIFGLVGTNQMDVTFSVPGFPGTAATVRGFGVVFTDVEVAGSTKLEFFDASNTLLHTEILPAIPPPVGGDSGKSFSFAGVSFDTPVVSRVRITNGYNDLDLQQFGAESDAVAMDDFIYGEPVPEPNTWLLGACVLALWKASVDRSRRERQRC